MNTTLPQHITCKTEAERTEVMDLLKKSGYKQVLTLWDFRFAPNVFIYGSSKIFQVVAPLSFGCRVKVLGSDFIKENN